MEKLKLIIEEQDKRLHELQAMAFQLANYYFVFQGVILVVLSNGTTSLRCQDSWFLFTLSLLAATLNFIALCNVAQKYRRILARRDENWFEYFDLDNRNLSEDDQTNNISSSDSLKEDSFTEAIRTLMLVLCMLGFIIFACITLYGCYTMFCREDICRNQYHDCTSDDKTIKLCDGGKCIKLCTRCH